jgi:hypothetical protein
MYQSIGLMILHISVSFLTFFTEPRAFKFKKIIVSGLHSSPWGNLEFDDIGHIGIDASQRLKQY